MKSIILKRFASICAAVAMCTAMAVPQAWADASDAAATIDLKPVEGQSSVDVGISNASSALKDVTAFSLALDIEITGGDAADVSESFAFSEAVKSMNPTIMRTSMPNTNRDNSVVRMNIYVAGVAPFSADSLEVGRLNLSVADGTTAQAKVVVPEGIDALSLVDNSYEQTDIPESDLFVPETPTVDLGATTNPPENEGNGGENGDGSGNGNGSGNDIIGQTAATNPVKGLPATGDTLMPVMIGLVCVAAVAVIAIIAVVVRKKKMNKQQ